MLVSGNITIVINPMIKWTGRRTKKKEYQYIAMIGAPARYGMTPGLKHWAYIGSDGRIYEDHKREVANFPTREDAMAASEDYLASIGR